MEAGKVCVGFSYPYVAKYVNTDGAISYTDGIRLARGVEVKVSPEVSDGNEFYADNIVAETDEGYFQKGTVDLTVDGLHQAAERFIFGLAEPEEQTFGEVKVKITKFPAVPNTPYVGIGYIAKYRSGGVDCYTPTILTKGKFVDNGSEHKTDEENPNYQTQSLKANLVRDDSAAQNWKWLLDDYSTEDAALAALKAVLGVTAAAAAES